MRARADQMGMAARLTAPLPRFLTLTIAVLVLVGAAATSSAPAAPPAATTRPVLVVPDVRRQPYVFAKGILEDAGFAWTVSGLVQGYAANRVVAQQPAPGTRVLDTGAPRIALSLARTVAYRERGTPQNSAPYRGTAVRFADLASAPAPAHVGRKAATRSRPASKPRPATRPSHPQKRPPAFKTEAPNEPLDEMPLPDRARLLNAWLAKHPRPTSSNVHHWLHQHEWVVTGARFGWWRGAEALRLLIEVDRRAERIWGIGARSEALARRTLAEVRAKAT